MSREQIESVCTTNRIRELWLDPVRGNFDAAHLKEINRRIFQDLPTLGFSDVKPGVYREAVPKGRDWIKTRKLKTADLITFVAYSSMDQKSIKTLESILERSKPKLLIKLNTETFAKYIADIYSELDYIHPFSDGNSRTLREFTRELADQCGYKIECERFNKESDRDLLYVARDLSVNKLALPSIKDNTVKRDILYTLDVLDGNPDLHKLLPDFIKRVNFFSL